MENNTNTEMRILKTRVRRKRLVRPSCFGLRSFITIVRSFFSFLRPSHQTRRESSPHSKRGVSFPHAAFQRRGRRRQRRPRSFPCEESEQPVTRRPESGLPDQ